MIIPSSPPDPSSSPYQRKRAGIPGDASPPGTNKRRRVESEETNGTYNDQISHPAASSALPESNIRRLIGKQPSLPEAQAALASHREDPSTPTQQSLRSRTHPVERLPNATNGPLHGAGHVRHASSGSNLTLHGPSHEPLAPTKQEQVTPPAVIVQSPATPNTGVTVNVSSTAWQNEPSASFSRRISNPSSHRPTPRKGPPSRLNFQTHSSGHGSLDNLAPSIRSAPPVPAPGQLASSQPPPLPSLGGNSTWLTNRSTGAQQPIQQQPRPRHTSHLSSSDLPTPRALARDQWPAIPTPTSLRLGARPIVPPTAAVSQASGVPTANSPSARLPITPAVPSPVPILGSGSGLQDKAKFMQKMSDIYDRATANSHKNCITVEEVDKRIREVVIARDHEISQLRKEVVELQKLLRQHPNINAINKQQPSGSVDEDGDVNMSGHSNPIRTGLAAASGGDRSTSIPRASPKPIESAKEGGATSTVPSEEVARMGMKLPSPPAIPNGITRHSPAAA